MSKKIGIITFHSALNYGAVLQTYALQTELEKLGCEAEVLNYSNPYVSTKLKPPQLRDYRNPLNYWKDVKKYKKDIVKGGKIRAFSDAKLHISAPLDRKGLTQYVSDLDAVITGSDQVWNDKITHNDDTFYLDVVSPHKRVSYAASIGSAEIPQESVRRIYPILKDFRAISVRETQAQRALLNQLGLEVQRVLDPTLLLCEEDYKGVIAAPKAERFVLVYMLFYSDSLIRSAREKASELGCKIYCVNASGVLVGDVVDCSDAGIEEWLGLMRDAQYVFTNSFHGVAFSVNFQKQFTAELPPARVQASSRITDLLDVLGMRNRIMTCESSPQVAIDYSAPNKRLNEERERSVEFLKKAVFGEPILKGKTVERSVLKFDPDLCSGCGYCANVCPVNAIAMEEDSNGFMYPVVSPLECINCGKCSRGCPTITQKREAIQPQVYAAVNQNREALMNSSSGGTFFAFAENILSQGGAVYGAAFNEHYELEHRRVTDISQIVPLMGSKYLQSNAFKVFPMVLQDLSQDIPVLFVGTPCQVAALRQLAGDNAHLYLVDFVCHGVPSPRLIRDHIQYVESYFHSRVVRYIPRSKQTRYGHDELFEFANGHIEWKHPVTQAYKYIFYSSSSSIRPSCSKCAFTNFARPGDLTVADFWGIEEKHPELKSSDGVSMILVNTDKGKKLLSEIDTLTLNEVSQEDIPEKRQPHLFRPIVIDEDKADLFWKEYHRFGWAYIARKYAECSRKDILKWKIKQTRFYKIVRGKA